MLLLDEPFGALDALTRSSLQDELIRIVEKTKTTVVMVTHDIDEAILLADRVVMMTNGPAARIGDVLEHLPAASARPDRTASNVRYGDYRRQMLDFLYRKQWARAESDAYGAAVRQPNRRVSRVRRMNIKTSFFGELIQTISERSRALVERTRDRGSITAQQFDSLSLIVMHYSQPRRILWSRTRRRRTRTLRCVDSG